ncbi:hypothetical protein CLV97_10360 [Planifilum fimeticola]|uniref:CAAX prenyl protease 2/Lysostaphin resistance protein A-like domain-containing protein n=1 Tax=Planifilum fimeticola TaxID=201975 RepID=A0A2T0LHZ2_9BACL|nr:type II CAAX endopeptidase family protein [Planifilum fimeticola]PRX42045.1 hypothetical protein CLV97_10360 [Planifilum fimeticola]
MISMLLQFLPFILILWLANMAEDRRYPEAPQLGRGFAIASYLMLGLIYVMFFLGGLFLLTLSLLPAEILEPEPEVNVRLLGIGIWAPSLVGLLFFIPRVRRWIARAIPIDPENPVHVISLSMSMLIILELLMILGIGLENLAAIGESENLSVSISELWTQDIAMLLLGLIGVGWLSRRKFGESLARLGIVKPSVREIAFGLGIGLLLVALAFGLEYVAAFFGISADPEVEELTKQLLGSLFTTVPGILTLGLAAALGEETVFRGALQPRFGLLLTSILFALMHSNYGFSLSTLIVFLVGLALGAVRLRFNTSTSMVVHATYNITLGVLANVLPDF